MSNNKPTISFWIISTLALIWNLMGVMAFSMDIMMSDEALSALPEAERLLYETNPAWSKLVYGVAVFGGTLGSIFLLMKNGSAKRVFIVSFIAIIIQMGYSLLFTNALDVYGVAGTIMPATVTLIGGFLIWYSGKCKSSGILV
jgi:hypothetical protein